MDDLIDTGDIAKMLGLTRETVTDRIIKQPGFPRPSVELNRVLRRWKRADVAAWLEAETERRRAGRQSRRAMSSADSR